MKVFDPSKKICLVYHNLVYGAPQALFDYLCSECFTVKKISLPLNEESEQVIRVTTLNRAVKNETTIAFAHTGFASYIVGFIKTIGMCWQRHHLYIGANPLNALAGIILRLFGRNNFVIFYSIDYNTTRFQSKFLNGIYKLIEMIAYRHSNLIWNLSNRMIDARESEFGTYKISSKNILVPIGVWTHQLNVVAKHAKEVNLVFIGHLLEKQGLQLVLEALRDLKLNGYHFKFKIVGGGPFHDILIALCHEFQLEDCVTFYGWVYDQDKIQSILRSSNLAVAMYDAKLDTFTYYADPTKLKEYLANALPVLMTSVPHNAYEIENCGCGRVVDYDVKNLTSVLREYMDDINLLDSSSRSAVAYAKKYIWDDVFKKAIIQSNLSIRCVK